MSAVGSDSADPGEFVRLTIGTMPSVEYIAGTQDISHFHITDENAPMVEVQFTNEYHQTLEGNNATFTVTLSEDAGRLVRIPIVYTPLSGASAADYAGSGGGTLTSFLSFMDNETSKTFSVQVATDSEDDGGETLSVSVGDLQPRVNQGAPASSIVYMVDTNDPEVTLTFSAETYNIDEDTPGDVTLTLDKDPERTIFIPITHTNVGATDDDHGGVPEVVRFNAGDTSSKFTFTPVDDTEDDDDEYVTVEFSSTALPPRVTAGTVTSSRVNIVDDDDPIVTLNFGSDAYTVAEGESVNVVAVLNADPERTVSIGYTVTTGGGASTADYTVPSPNRVTFNAGETSKNITVSATDDVIDDDDETITLTFSSTLPDRVIAGVDTATTVSILDDDDPDVKVMFESAAYNVVEGSSVDVAVTLDVEPERSVTIPISTAETGATSADYSGVVQSLTFGATDTRKTFTVSVTDDMIDDDDEYITLSFGTLPSQVTAGTTSTARVNFGDDDVPTVVVNYGSGSHTVAEGGHADYHGDDERRPGTDHIRANHNHSRGQCKRRRLLRRAAVRDLQRRGHIEDIYFQGDPGHRGRR